MLRNEEVVILRLLTLVITNSSVKLNVWETVIESQVSMKRMNLDIKYVCHFPSQTCEGHIICYYYYFEKKTKLSKKSNNSIPKKSNMIIGNLGKKGSFGCIR